MGLIIFIVILVIVVATIIALAFPKSAPGMWIAQAYRDAFSFAYQEVGTVLKLLKYPVPGSSPVEYKFSSKRVAGLGLVVSVVGGGIPANWLHLVFDGAELAVAGVLFWYAAKTKT